MVHVFIANIKELPDALDKPCVLEGLPDERKEKILRIKRLKERKQSLGAGLLLEHAKRELGEDYQYNLSHSGDYVLCAASKEAVGCDIEKIKEAPLKVAKRYFCESEICYLNEVPEAERDEEFFRLWTIKESYTKMLKKGLSMGLDSFEVILGENPYISKDGKKLNCYIKEYALDNYKVAVCSGECEFQEKLNYVSL